MRAIILAGGKGTRLRPYTTLIPKPLVPLGGEYSILEIIIMQLSKSGFTHITLAVNHLSQLIMAYFGDGERLGVKIDYSLEEGELSTIGPLTLIDDLPENFLVMNGDILCDLNYKTFFDAHVDAGSRISVSAFRREVKIDFGVLRYDESGRLNEFQEKPEYDFDVSMGIYCMEPAILDLIPKGVPYGFDDLMRQMLRSGLPVYVYKHEGLWMDIGREEDFLKAQEIFMENHAPILGL